MEDPRIVSPQFNSPKTTYYNVLVNTVGRGYTFEVTLPDKYAFKCVPAEENQPLFTIYQEENNIYWIPDIQTAGNIYNRDTERMEPQIFNGEVRLCKFDIYI